jgi:hypothetical protein
MQHDWVLWLAATAIAMHTIEERLLNWLPWGRRRLRYNGTWEHYYVLTGALGLAGVAAAVIGWRFPIYAVGLLVEMYIDAIFLHIAPTIWYREFSPGVLSSVFIYLPVASVCLYYAASDGVLSPAVLVLGFLLGLVFHLWPFILNLLIPWRERQTGNPGRS